MSTTTTIVNTPTTTTKFSNRKSKLCVNYTRDGSCRYGDKCNFAHGTIELATIVRNVPPCWFHNNGGCSKTADQCSFAHTIASTVRKPLFAQRPCQYFHSVTPRQCRHGDQCKWDHSYELNEREWRNHFFGIRFPGAGYLTPEPTVVPAVVQQRVVIDSDDSNQFPLLAVTPTPTNTPRKNAWTTTPVVPPTPTNTRHKNAWTTTPVVPPKEKTLAEKLTLLANRLKSDPKLSEQASVEDAIAIALKEMIA